MRRKRRTHSPELKAKVALAALKGDQTIAVFNDQKLTIEEGSRTVEIKKKDDSLKIAKGNQTVDITSGKFVFSANEAYLIENGKVTTLVKGAMLIGSGAEVLTRVSMVGSDLKLDRGVGVCGKDGQSVPVGVGQPTLKIDTLTVGGTQA